MKREFLKELGLDKEQIDKIMEENGKDINATKDDAKKELDDKDKEIETLTTQSKDLQKDLKKYQDMNIDDIKKNADEWENKFNDTQKELADFKNNSLLEKELLGANAHDIEMLGKAINHDLLKFENGKVIGLDEQLKELQKEKAFLFKKVEDNNNDDNKDGKFNPLEIDNSNGGDGKTALESQADQIFGLN